MSTLSIISICQDEGEVIGWFLDCCVQTYQVLGDALKEVIIVDGGSIDNTLAVLKQYQSKLPLIIIEHPFDTFGKQKNLALEKATGDFILGADTDMTWTTNFAEVFKRGTYDNFKFVDFMCYFTCDDAYHYFNWPMGVTMRLWKRGPLFVTEFHEKLAGQGQGLPVCAEVSMFKNNFRGSDYFVMHRGIRYQQFTKQMEAEGGGPGGPTRYFDAKHAPQEAKLNLPEQVKQYVLPQDKV